MGGATIPRPLRCSSRRPHRCPVCRPPSAAREEEGALR
uniref:Uncharacterized protein n=1 Tax=Arundo donax TaxID=35708 RepID=A0A0A8YPZ4_ARUDO